MRRKNKKEQKKPGKKNFFRRHKKLTILLSIVLILVLAATVLVVNMKKNMANSDTSVTTAQATVMDIENDLTSDGKIAAATEEKIAPHTGYTLKAVLVEEGQSLAEGDHILQYTNGQYLSAPYPCVIEKINLPDPKQALTADHYVKIGSTDTLAMSLTVNESDFSEISIGQKVEITPAASGNVYTGNITFISDLADYSDTGSTFDATVTFQNDGSLRVGMTGTATVILEKAKNVVAVPEEAVQEGEDGSYVVVVNSDKTTTDTPVETGISDGTNIEIKSGLKGGETIQYYASDDNEDDYGY